MVIDYHLDKLIKSGFEMVVINLHYLGEQIEEHITSNFSGKIKIIFSHEKEILGTCGGILNAIDHCERNFTWTGFSIINSSFFQGMETKYSDYWEDLMIHLAAEEKVVADIPNINWYDVGIKDTLDFLNSE